LGEVDRAGLLEGQDVGFWDKVKGFFGGRSAAAPGTGLTDLDPVFEEKIRAAILARIERRAMFVAVDIADAATAEIAGRTSPMRAPRWRRSTSTG
jgi:hypothetical protein